MPDRFLLAAIAAAVVCALPSLAGAQGSYSRFDPVPAAGAGAQGAAGVPASGYGMAPYGAMAPSAPPSGVVDPNHRLQQGDQLLVRIEQDRDGNIPVLVSQAGEVVIEPLAPVRVAGMTVSQAQSELKRLLEKDYYYSATVRLTLTAANVNAGMGAVYLSGYVKREGAIPMYAEKPLTLSQAILAAGGFATYADDRKVRVTRGGGPGGTPQTFVVDVKAILKEGRMEKDVTLQDKDNVYVPDTFIRR